MLSTTPRHARRGIFGVISSFVKWLRDARISVYSTVLTICFTVIVFLFCFLFFRPTVVSGSSMYPTLFSKDLLLLNGVSQELGYGDIAVIRRDNNTLLIKRVIGLAGDTIYINEEDGCVYRNGERLNEPYAVFPTPAQQLTGEVLVPLGHIFVLGDNRVNSHDSRYNDIGMVPVDTVIGKAVYRLYPFKSAGKLSTEG